MARERLEKTISGAGNRKTIPDSEELEMLAMRQKGWTLQAIGSEYDLTRQRVQQIMAKYFRQETAQITAPKIRKPTARGPTKNKPLILVWDDGSSSSEPAIVATMRKYGLTTSLGAMLHNQSTKRIYSKVLDAYVISARLL